MKMHSSFWPKSSSLIIIASILICVQSCNKGSSPLSPQEQTRALLTSGTWKLQSESADGVDQTNMYKGFVINFTSTGFTTQNGLAIWPANGSWSFKGETTTIQRNDGLNVQINVTNSSLIMTLTWATSTLGSGRNSSTGGVNVFTLVK